MMKRITFLLLAVAMLLLGAVGAGPADARRPKGGEQTMVLNQDQATGQFGVFGCPELSWFGSIDINGKTYGMALYPLPGGSTNGPIFNYVEAWKVWSGEFGVSYDDASDRYLVDDCEPGRVLAAGTDEGVADLSTGEFSSDGTVDEAYKRFRSWLGRPVHQVGQVGPVDFDDLVGVVGFNGRLELLDKDRPGRPGHMR